MNFPNSNSKKRKQAPDNNQVDYYFNEEGRMVFTAQYHLKRGHCCQNGCKHCPYGFNKKEKS